MTQTKSALFISLCYFLFTFGYIVSIGFYHVGELVILLLVTALLFAFYFKPQVLINLNIPKSKDVLIFILTLIMVVNIAQMGARLGDSSQTNWMFFSSANRVLATFALFLSISYFLKKMPALLLKSRFWLLIIIAVIIRIFSIVSSPNPPIDVFYILRDGPRMILEGKNPYQLNYPAPYGVYIPTIIFHYGPLTPFIFLPSVLLFNDPRFTLIIAELAAAYVLFCIGKSFKADSNLTKLIIVIFLFHPLFPFMIEHAWPESITTLLLFFAVYFLNRQPGNIAGGIALGAILAIKSVYILPLITYLASKRAKLSQYILTILIPVVLSIPFMLANAQLFLERTQVYVTNPEKIAQNLAPTNISLSISAVILKYTNIVLPTVVVILMGLIVALITLFKKPKNHAAAVLSIFLVFIVLFMFGPYVFVYNFAFLGNILLLCLLFSLSEKTTSNANL